MPVKAADVSDYVIKRLTEKNLVPLLQLKLHKLLYFCQKKALENTSEVLFPDVIEAWSNGPVVPSIWNEHRYERFIDSEPGGDRKKLDADDRQAVEETLAQYGHFDAFDLVDLTHKDVPWKKARQGFRPGERSNVEITPESIRESITYFPF